MIVGVDDPRDTAAHAAADVGRICVRRDACVEERTHGGLGRAVPVDQAQVVRPVLGLGAGKSLAAEDQGLESRDVGGLHEPAERRRS